MPLDEFLPDYDANEVHSTRVSASPDRVLGAAREVTARDVPLLVGLMALRTLPTELLRVLRLHDCGHPGRLRAIDMPLLEGVARAGFVVLADRRDELVFGVVGRFWRLDSGIEPVAADEFVAFSDPGFAKGVFNFHVREIAGGTLLTTETRVKGTDERARRNFGRYWRIVMPGSALIRRAWLRAIRKRAERGRAGGA